MFIIQTFRPLDTPPPRRPYRLPLRFEMIFVTISRYWAIVLDLFFFGSSLARLAGRNAVSAFNCALTVFLPLCLLLSQPSSDCSHSTGRAKREVIPCLDKRGRRWHSPRTTSKPYGAPGGIRTRNNMTSNHTLYPVELTGAAPVANYSPSCQGWGFLIWGGSAVVRRYQRRELSRANTGKKRMATINLKAAEKQVEALTLRLEQAKHRARQEKQKETRQTTGNKPAKTETGGLLSPGAVSFGIGRRR